MLFGWLVYWMIDGFVISWVVEWLIKVMGLIFVGMKGKGG